MVNIVAGDYGYDLDFTATDVETGSPLDLNSASVLFKTRVQGSTGSAALIGSCVIDVGSDGTCHYPVQLNDIDDVGRYEWELEAIYSGKKVTSLGSPAIVVKDSIP